MIKSTYVLPDGVTHTKGYVKDPQSAKSFLTLGLSDGGANTVMDKVDVEKKKADMNKNVKRKDSHSLLSVLVGIFCSEACMVGWLVAGD